MQRPASVLRTMLAGQVMLGNCASTTVTVNSQVAMLSDESVTFQLTTVGVPTGKVEPLAVLGGLVRVKVQPVQLSLTVGVA